jgi:hypothetical protein
METYWSKKELRQRLEAFREKYQESSQRQRLRYIPMSCIAQLFNISNQSACHFFGKQLVLKIIDELLDEGEPNG